MHEEVNLPSYAIDLHPVTNQDFARFLKESGYRPDYSENFLKHWTHGKIPAGLENHSVVYVSLEDARAYATWAGDK